MQKTHHQLSETTLNRLRALVALYGDRMPPNILSAAADMLLTGTADGLDWRDWCIEECCGGGPDKEPYPFCAVAKTRMYGDGWTAYIAIIVPILDDYIQRTDEAAV